MKGFLVDLRHAARNLAARPGFAAAAIVSLAIGIGADTAIFSVVYGVLLRPLPYPHADRLVDVAEVDARGRSMRVSDANYLDLRDQSRAFDELGEYSAWDAAIATPAEAFRAKCAMVSRGFFEAFGAQPSVGRSFTAEERSPGGPAAAIVGDRFWRTHLGAARDLSGATIRIDGVPHAVVGVMPPGFPFPDGAQVWRARERFPWLPGRTAHNDRVVGLLRAGVPVARAQADVSAIARRLAAENGKRTDMQNAAVTPLRETLVGRIRPALLLLLGAAGALFLVGCVDVVALLLARAASRRREIAIRRALGAGRLDLVRTFLAEALGIAVPGGGLGILLSAALVGALARLAPPDLPRAGEIAVDAPVVAAAVLLAVFAAALLAVATAWSEFGSRLADVLRGNQSTGDRRTRRAQRVLSVGQLAMTAALLAGVALLGRSLTKLLDVPLGFDPKPVLTMTLYLPDADTLYLPGTDAGAFRARRKAQIAALLERLGRLPGVERVGATDSLPLGDGFPDGTFLLMAPGQALSSLSDFERLFRDPARTGSADYALATGGYFPAMGIPLLRGRLFDARDSADAPHVAVISETLARSRFRGRDPIGQTIEFGNMDGDLRTMTVVGVVGDVHPQRLEDPPEPVIYGNVAQRQKGPAVTVVLRSSGDPLRFADAARKAARELDPTVPVTIRSMDEVIAAAVASRRLGLVLLSLFSGAALVLACTGLAGITAYAIAQRQREMGIRTALGARPVSLLTLLLSEQARLVAAGIAAGTVLAVVFAGFARAILFGVEAADPVSLASSAAVLAACAAIAIVLPSLRLLRLPAAEALRQE
ncbi:MAG TPA: ADOP family duplicated permease [Thermoanaerobaculia bacterium]|nr:ADOP family duplicated permease [Thermoanaerobaculia bacterium]